MSKRIDLRKYKISGTAVLVYDKDGIWVSTGAWVDASIGGVEFAFNKEDSPFDVRMLGRMRNGTAVPADVKGAILSQVAKLCTADVVAQFMAAISSAHEDGAFAGSQAVTAQIRLLLGIE